MKRISRLSVAPQPRPPRKPQPRPPRKRKPKGKPIDPIENGLLIFLVLVLVLSSIATFTGGLLTASINIKASVALLAAFALTLRMEYGIIKLLIK